MSAASATAPFIFICGADDYLVGRLGKARYNELAAEITDEFSRETINGFANNLGEVETALNQFRDSVQTVSMFGGRRLVWLKDVNFLADTVTGRSDGCLALVADLQELLDSLDPAHVAVLITAAPIDRRRSFPKWCEKRADFTLIGGGEADGDSLAGILLAEARLLGITFGEGAPQLLLAKIGPNTRLLIEEVRKLATHAEPGPDGQPPVIEEAHVADLTPNVAEGDFFEAAEAFFSGDLKWTLAALHRHFFTGGDSRPILSALQNRNRILIQVRALLDSGEVRLGPRGLDKSGFERAAAAYAKHFIGVTEKSAYHLFSQNAWYVGKLASAGKLPTLRRLIDNQQEFLRAFEEIVQRPKEQEDVLREMTVRCLTT